MSKHSFVFYIYTLSISVFKYYNKKSGIINYKYSEIAKTGKGGSENETQKK